jgi:hypothetical protein
VKVWQEGFDDIPQRSFDRILAETVLAPPPEFKFQQYESEAALFVESLGAGVLAGKSVVAMPGRVLNFASDALFSSKRFLHALDCARTQFERGAVTWSLVDAHHVLLLGYKAVAAFYGIFLYGIWDRTIIVDFFPHLGAPKAKAAFSRSFGHVIDPVAIYAPGETKVSQRQLRTLLKRIGGIVVKQSAEERTFFNSLGHYLNSSNKTPRNNVLYSSVWWEWPKDLDLSSGSKGTKAALCDDPEEGYPKFMTLLDSLEDLNRSLVDKLSLQISFDVASLHALAKGTGGRALVA